MLRDRPAPVRKMEASGSEGWMVPSVEIFKEGGWKVGEGEMKRVLGEVGSVGEPTRSVGTRDLISPAPPPAAQFFFESQTPVET